MTKIIYMDAAASSLKFQSVIDTQIDFVKNHYANAGRGVCQNTQYVDNMIQNSRSKVAKFIGANTDNIVWTGGTTDSMNRIVRMITKFMNKKLDVVVSDLDHHSARLPWQILKNENLCDLSVAQLDDEYNLTLNNIKTMDVLVITAMSNVLGNQQDVKKIIKDAKKINPNVITIVDAAQFVVHKDINCHDFDCDFLCFSGHKMGADTGVGVMYVKDVNKWTPDNFGGGMVIRIEDEDIELATGAHKFEAGTLPLTQIAGMSAAIDNMTEWENTKKLNEYFYEELSKIDRVKILTNKNSSLVTFVIDDMHCLDFGALIGANGICLRVGNMCATWIHEKLGVTGTIRISTGWWNTMDEAEKVVTTIKKTLG